MDILLSMDHYVHRTEVVTILAIVLMVCYLFYVLNIFKKS